MAVIAFGVTAYEMAALGIPALYLPISADHARSASAFVSAGLGLALPEHASAETIGSAVTGLMANDAGRRDMRLAGPGTVDGQGAGRIAADLAEAAARRS